jgi:ATP adenylyltransferase
VSRAKEVSRPGVPEALNAWPGAATGDDEAHSYKGKLERADCVFCNMIGAVDYAIEHGFPQKQAEKAVHILHRGSDCFVCLNAFPYSTGHILIVPYVHVDSLAALAEAAAMEMISLAQRAETVLRSVYQPAGLNFGLNLGEAGGAGIAGHIHMHGLPRWVGDTNFMTVTANTRVLPEDLDTTWEKIRLAWPTDALPQWS